MPTCAIYARVSDELQMKGESVVHQVSFMREFARRRGEETHDPWLTPDHFIYQDQAISGTSIIKRTAVQQLVNDAKARRFDVVLFKGISRFARDTVDALVMLRVLQACGLRVISFEENFDSARDSAELIFTMHSAVAQYESEKIGIRVRIGNFEKAREGKWSGQAPDGYVLNRETRKLEIDPVRSPVIEKIFRYYERGDGCFKVAERLNEEGIMTPGGRLWSLTKIHRIIRNPAYCGDVVYGQREQGYAPPSDEDPLARRKQTRRQSDPEAIAVCRDAHAAIVERERWTKLQETMERRRGMPGRVGHAHLLTGLLKCKCGSAMGIKTNHVGVRYYRCLAKYTKGKHLCDQKYIRADILERHVVERLKSDIRAHLDLDKLVRTANSRPRKKDPSAAQLERVTKELEREIQKSMSLFDRHMDGQLSAEQFDAMNTLVRGRIGTLTRTKEDLLRRSAMHQQSQDVDAQLAEALQIFLTAPLTREALRRLVQEIRIKADNELVLAYTWG